MSTDHTEDRHALSGYIHITFHTYILHILKAIVQLKINCQHFRLWAYLMKVIPEMCRAH